MSQAFSEAYQAKVQQQEDRLLENLKRDALQYRNNKALRLSEQLTRMLFESGFESYLPKWVLKSIGHNIQPRLSLVSQFAPNLFHSRRLGYSTSSKDIITCEHPDQNQPLAKLEAEDEELLQLASGCVICNYRDNVLPEIFDDGEIAQILDFVEPYYEKYCCSGNQETIILPPNYFLVRYHWSKARRTIGYDDFGNVGYDRGTNEYIVVGDMEAVGKSIEGTIRSRSEFSNTNFVIYDGNKWHQVRTSVIAIS